MIWVLGLRVQSFSVYGSGSRVQGRGFIEVWGLESQVFGVEGLAMPPDTLEILDGVVSQNLSTLLPPKARIHSYLTESVNQVILQKAMPAQIRQLILHCI